MNAPAADVDRLALTIHDLKNSLSLLEGQLSALVDAPSAEGARRARGQCADMRRRLVAFLMLHGGEDGWRLSLSDEDPRALLQTAARRYREALAPDHPVKIDVLACDDAPAFFYLDRHLVQLALDAALHNACVYARSRVEVSARRDGDALAFVIDDDGPGPVAAPRQDASTGLGTALCVAVARAHRNAAGDGGDVALTARGEGGARFTLRVR
jgi:signal transduction histidine kinase